MIAVSAKRTCAGMSIRNRSDGGPRILGRQDARLLWFGPNSLDRTEASRTIIRVGLFNLGLGVHDKGTARDHPLVQRTTGIEQSSQGFVLRSDRIGATTKPPPTIVAPTVPEFAEKVEDVPQRGAAGACGRPKENELPPLQMLEWAIAIADDCDLTVAIFAGRRIHRTPSPEPTPGGIQQCRQHRGRLRHHVPIRPRTFDPDQCAATHGLYI